jgi:hypothetical protein
MTNDNNIKNNLFNSNLTNGSPAFMFEKSI